MDTPIKRAARETFFSWGAARFYLGAVAAIVAVVVFSWQSQATQDACITENSSVLLRVEQWIASTDGLLQEIKADVKALRESLSELALKVERLDQKVEDMDRRVERLSGLRAAVDEVH